MLRMIKTRFRSKCAETGKSLPKGVNAMYDDVAKKVYCMESDTSTNFLSAKDNDYEGRATLAFVKAQEEAYFDNLNQNL